MEFACGFYQVFPVLDVLVKIVFAEFDVDFLQFRVETNHQLFALSEIGYFISDGYQSQFCLLQNQKSKQQAVSIVGLDQLRGNIKSSSDLSMFFENLPFNI